MRGRRDRAVSNVPVKGVIDTLAMLPLAVPGLVLAFGYLSISIWFKQKLGERTPRLLDVQRWPVLLLVIAYAARRLPYVVRIAPSPACSRRRATWSWPRRTSARSRPRVLRRITVPLILANLVAGALLAFAFAMLEVSDSLILAQTSRFYPITKAI